MLGHFNSAIVDPICREVETDLRLHIHSVIFTTPDPLSSIAGACVTVRTY